MDKNYQGVIWTTHALERLKERNISQGDAWATFNRPDTSRKGQKQGVYVYYKTWPYTDKNRRKRFEKIEVVATQNEKKEWIILSVWSKPADKSEVQDKKSFLRRIFGL